MAHRAKLLFIGPANVLTPALKKETTMFGYGLLGTLLIICLIVWLVRRA
jgi:hypothetical protein